MSRTSTRRSARISAAPQTTRATNAASQTARTSRTLEGALLVWAASMYAMAALTTITERALTARRAAQSSATDRALV